MSDIRKVKVDLLPSYDISIVLDLIGHFDEYIDVKAHSSVFVLSDENVASIYGDKLLFEHKLIKISAGESAKNIETIQQIWQQLFDLGADRKSLLINLGGGVIGDIGGFAAATYMRGIDFVNIPTTLLAAADASIGGKTGFNFAGIKNLIGTFTQPKAVLVDVETFKTLDSRIYNEGFAEIVKHAAISDARYFEYLEQVLPNPSQEQLVEILEKSCQIKAGIVVGDERESGLRKQVNFGHTIGHAIESLSHEQSEALFHGEAVAIGMVAEARLGEVAGVTELGTSDRIISLLTKVNLPTEIPEWLDQNKMNSKLMRDKKNDNQTINWTLLAKIGVAQIDIQIDGNLIKHLF